MFNIGNANAPFMLAKSGRCRNWSAHAGRRDRNADAGSEVWPLTAVDVGEPGCGLSAFGPAAERDQDWPCKRVARPSWEAAAMHELALDEINDIKLKIREVADSKAGQVALQAGKVDVILSDFVWVSLQRDQGADFTFVPHSLAVGGLMAAAGQQGQIAWPT